MSSFSQPSHYSTTEITSAPEQRPITPPNVTSLTNQAFEIEPELQEELEASQTHSQAETRPTVGTTRAEVGSGVEVGSVTAHERNQHNQDFEAYDNDTTEQSKSRAATSTCVDTIEQVNVADAPYPEISVIGPPLVNGGISTNYEEASNLDNYSINGGLSTIAPSHFISEDYYDLKPALFLLPTEEPTKLEDIKKWSGVSMAKKLELYQKLKNQNQNQKDNQNDNIHHETAASPNQNTENLKSLKNTVKDKYVEILTNNQGLINNYLFNRKIKHITLNYGYQVATYFDISRDLLKLNIYTLLLMLFVIIPQIVVQPWTYTEQCTFAGVISGVTCLKESILYYGFYGMQSDGWQNSTGSWFPSGYYNLPLAYQLTVIAFYVINLILVSSDAMQSWKKGIQVGLLSGNDLASKVFCAWDFSIGKQKTKETRQRQIMVMLKEEIDSKKDTGPKTKFWDKDGRYARLGIMAVSWLTYFLILAGIGVAMWFSTANLTTVEENGQSLLKLWILPLIVTSVNFLMPIVISFLSWLFQEEKSAKLSPSAFYYTQMIRNIFFRLAVLIILFISWYQNLYLSDSANACWQTDVGTSIFRILVFDIVVGQVLIDLVINGLLRSLFVKLWKNKVAAAPENNSDNGNKGDSTSEGGENQNQNQNPSIWKNSSEAEKQKPSDKADWFRKPEFQVVDSILDLLFSQSLVWLGIFFFPMVSTFVIVQLVLIIYIKAWLLDTEILTPEAGFRAIYGKTIIAVMQLLTLFASIIWIGLVFTTDPSTSCGVFRFGTSYGQPFQDAISELSSNSSWGWFGVLVQIFTDPWTIYTINIGLLSACYVAWQYTNAHKKNVNRLKSQLKEFRDQRGLVR